MSKNSKTVYQYRSDKRLMFDTSWFWGPCSSLQLLAYKTSLVE